MAPGLLCRARSSRFALSPSPAGQSAAFHTLISSGITPKIITREQHARPIGYGAMCLESLVAIMALIAACTLEPGVYLAMNVKGTPAEVAAKVEKSGFTALAPDPSNAGRFQPAPVTVSEARMTELAGQVGEHSLYGRTGGAATLAVGMANIFSKLTGGRWLDLWYHFAIMFEALFILTTLDAGTRVGRYLLQDALGHISRRLGDTRSFAAGFFCQPARGTRLGLFPDSRCARSSRRYQFALARLWNRESASRQYRTLPGDDDPSQNGIEAQFFTCAGAGCLDSAHVAPLGDFHGRLAKDLSRRTR
jgi:hypothetical protein